MLDKDKDKPLCETGHPTLRFREFGTGATEKVHCQLVKHHLGLHYHFSAETATQISWRDLTREELLHQGGTEDD
jgi:hypothetical protein